ncbi:MAG: dephospho-CoA kinase [Clostridiales bacterium]|nr:dephospho-CoA kinase [Clostridiales bacterium]
MESAKGIVIGLTGGIASGKSIASNALEEYGFNVIDADEISRQFFGPWTDGEKEILALFPQCEKDGRLDRTALRALISRSAPDMHKLNDFTHPRITAEIKRILATCVRHVVLSAPLLFETALSALCDCTVCVVCPYSKRIARLMARDDMDEESAKRLIDAQIPDEYRATLADYCISSDKPIKEFCKDTVNLFVQISNS